MEANRKVTIHDIAEKAQVSISTVSRVLNKNSRVAEEKRQAILRVIAELDYKPNMFAQGLARGQSMTIGVLTQRISSPIYDAVLLGIMQGIEGSGYLPFFADGNWDPEVERVAIEKLIEKKVDGFIIIGGNLPAEELPELAQRVPLLVIGRDIPALEDQCLRLDNHQGGVLATRYLIESGHRRIAHLTGLLTHPDAAERRDGYLHALAEAGLEANPELIIDGDYTESSGLMAVEMLLMRGQVFSAIFAANDQMAFGARLALYRRGFRVPEDVSIIGFDDQSAAAYMTPPLTTVRFPAMEMGRTAGQTILRLIKGEEYRLPVFQTSLTIRESVARR